VHRLKSILVLLAVVTLGAATVAFAQDRGRDDDGDRRGDDRGGWKDDDRGDRGRWDDDDDDDDDRGDRGRRRFARAALRNAAGERVGKVFFKQSGDDEVLVFGRARNLPPGFHGFHIHTTGICEPPFTSAGGHYNPDGASHRDHAGDMPSLLINGDGSGFVAFATDRFTIDELRSGDGSAVMVHSASDNYANIPNRYRSPGSPPEGGPDAETLATGDAGSRMACGVVR
jgi:Cu-Zn family superoxide dismutase